MGSKTLKKEMKQIFLLISIVEVWIGTPVLIIWEWSMWWDQGHTFWVFLSVFTGIGWIPAWFMGIAHLFGINVLLALAYLGCMGYYASQAFSD